MWRVGIVRCSACASLLVASLACGQSATAPAEADAASQHIPPDPPQQTMGDMSYKDMVSMMQMDDTHRFGKVMLDQLEWRDAQEGAAAAWDAEGWYGGDYDKLWIKTEGERVNGLTLDASADLLLDHVIARWWDAQAGLRQDFGKGPARTWLALGLQGLAPYWLDVEATFYASDEGRTAARLKADYDLLLTQRLILQPYGEVNLYGKSDPERQIGSGVSDLQLTLRLRYEVRRELAPYIGVGWFKRFGRTAELARAAGEGSDAAQLVAGVRIWF
jgi:copper resistance protein B